MTQQPWGQPSSGQQAGRPAQQHQWGQPQQWGQQQFSQQQFSQQQFGQQQFGQQQFRQAGGQPAWGAPQGQPQQWGQDQRGLPSPGGFQAPAPRPTKPRISAIKLIALGVAAVVAISAVAGLVQSLGNKTGGSAASYQNEDYKAPPPDTNPPEIPMPKVQSDLTTLTKDNPVYQQSVPIPTRCELNELNLTNPSSSAIKAHMDQLTACLMKVWDEPLKKAGWTMVRPVSNVYSATIDTPCGRAKTGNAFFCTANQQIYYATDLPKLLPADVRNAKFGLETVIAHEVGHGIQYRTGIGASSYLMEKDSSKDDAKKLSRRMETQADCFSGLFLASVSQSRGMTNADLNNIRKIGNALGDDSLTGDPNYNGDHGQGRNRQYWIEMGLASSKIGACNTWTAPENLVR